jgi:hypothetical protein
LKTRIVVISIKIQESAKYIAVTTTSREAQLASSSHNAVLVMPDDLQALQDSDDHPGMMPDDSQAPQVHEYGEGASQFLPPPLRIFQRLQAKLQRTFFPRSQRMP